MADDEDGGIGGAACPEKPNVPEPSTAIRFAACAGAAGQRVTGGSRCPTGKSVLCLSSPPCKNIPIPSRPKSLLYLWSSRPNTEGRFAIVTNVRSGCDGRGGATDERANLRT